MAANVLQYCYHHHQLAMPRHLACSCALSLSPTDVVVARSTSSRTWGWYCAGIVLRSALQPLHIPADGTTPALQIAVGTLVAVSPFLTHHDERFYAQPHRYHPARHLRSRTSRTPTAVSIEDATACGAALYRSQSAAGESSGSEQAAPPPDPNPVAIAFGAGIFRCPGRAFARSMLRAAVAALFSDGDMQWDLHTGHADVPAQARPARHTPLPPAWLTPTVVPGRHVFSRGLRSGDKRFVLPGAQPQLLVGVKRPTGELWAECESAA